MIEQGFYHPEPFIVPEVGSSRPSTDIGHGTRRGGSSIDLAAGGLAPSSAGGRPDTAMRERRASQATMSSSDPSSAVTPNSRGRAAGKAHPPSSMRPANFVQHEDAAVAAANGSDGEQVVELPPTYSQLRPKKVANANPTDT